MKPPLTCEHMLRLLSSDFALLWNCRPRGNTLEIITPFSTITQQFVSVFITIRDNEYVVSDGGWVAKELNLYQLPDVEDLDYDFQVEHFSHSFGVRTFTHRGEKFFYKRCSKPELLSGAVYDLCSFVCSLVNSLSLPKQDKQEKAHTERFQTEATSFLVANAQNFHGAQIIPRFQLEGLQSVTFGAAIQFPGHLSLVTYVTGSRQNYFSNALKASIVAFELAEKSKYQDHGMIRSKVALLNNHAEGYAPARNEELMPLLRQHGAKAVNWTEKEQLVPILQAAA